MNPTGFLREPWEPGHRTTSSSPLLAFPQTFQLLIFFPYFFSFLLPLLLPQSTWGMELWPAWRPLSLIFLWSPQGRYCFSHFINEETEAQRRYIWTAPLTTQTPAATIIPLEPCCQRTCHFKTRSPIQSKRKSHLLVGFGPIQPDAWDHSPKHSCSEDSQAYPSSIHILPLGKPQP